jgi:hypothetical protein
MLKQTWEPRILTLAALVCLIVAGSFAVARPALVDLTGGPTATDSAQGRPHAVPKLAGRVVGQVGVVSLNADGLRGRAARADWDRITANKAVDLIGWQESGSPAFRALFPRYREAGWDTWYHSNPRGPRSLAVSWRRAVFGLEGVRWWRVQRGDVRASSGSSAARWVVAVTLRHRASGLRLTVLNTQVGQQSWSDRSDRGQPSGARGRRQLAMLTGLWDTVPGDVVLGTGDYSYDFAHDSGARPHDGLASTFAGHAVASYDALGLESVTPTHRHRWTDYVFLATRSVRRASGPGLAQFAMQRTLSGFSSDHAPLLARVRLYARGGG